MTSVDLVKSEAGGADEDDSDEVAVVLPDEEDTDAPVAHDRATVDVKAAIDPPGRVLAWEDLVGSWNLPGRKTIRPLWLQSWANFKGVAWWLTRYLAYQVTYHATRSPKYLYRASIRVGRGAWYVTRDYMTWLLDLLTRREMKAIAGGKNSQDYLKLDKHRHENVHKRLVISALYICATLILFTVSQIFVPWATWVGVLAALIALIIVGEPEDEPLFDVAMANQAKLVRLTSKMVLTAVGALGISAVNQALKEDPKGGVKFYEGISRDPKTGFRLILELPPGVTATEVMDKREKLAAGLRRPLGCVWPERLKGGHPGLLSLFVGDEDMNTAKQPQWPLRKSGVVDLFKPQPFGTDQRGEVVHLTLMYTSGAIGAVPRVGKTFSLRELLLIAALDPRSELHVHDLKGSGDLSALEHVAHAYTVGDEEEDLLLALAALKKLHGEMRRRYKVLRKLPKHEAPETKVTPDLADRRDLGLHPVVMGVDECQRWFEHKEYGSEFTELCSDFVKRGPAAGIITLYATQRPDAKSLPKEISDNVVLRYCLKVMDSHANNMVLGNGAYASGANATLFAFEDKGIGYLLAEGADRQIVKTFYIDSPNADQVALRARKVRAMRGSLSGYCIGDEESAIEEFSLATDLPRVFVTSERLHSEDIVSKLQEIRPSTYDGWTVTTFANALWDQLGVKTKQIKIGGKNLAGLRRDALHEALVARELDRAPNAPLELDKGA